MPHSGAGIPALLVALLWSTGADAQPPLRTAWGDPDLRGLWNHGTATPLERPDRYAGRTDLRAEERAEIDAAARSTDGVGARRAVWWERPLSDGRTSLITDPSDGRIPYQASRGAAPGPERRDGPEDLPLQARCLSYGVPRLGGPYSQNIHLLQTPDHVVLVHEMTHEIRIVPLDGRPRVSPAIPQWMGEARGHWEGDSLVVESRDFDPRQRYRGRSMGATSLVERFTRIDADTVDYEVTFEDPTLWTRPWTARMALARTEGPMFEFACHEGNYGMTGILETARHLDAATR